LTLSTEGEPQGLSTRVADLLEARADAWDVFSEDSLKLILSDMCSEQACHIAVLVVPNVRFQVVSRTIEEEGNPEPLLNGSGGALGGGVAYRSKHSPSLVCRLASE
jgi:hypothetical protein